MNHYHNSESTVVIPYSIVKGCCPKCEGGNIVIYKVDGVLYQAKCLDCDNVGPFARTSEEAVSSWNKGIVDIEMTLSEFIDKFKLDDYIVEKVETEYVLKDCDIQNILSIVAAGEGCILCREDIRECMRQKNYHRGFRQFVLNTDILNNFVEKGE